MSTKEEWPEGLKEVRHDPRLVVGEKLQELQELNAYGWDVEFDWRAFEDALTALPGDVYALSEFWYGRFTGGVYFGIMSADPWWRALEGQYNGLDDEEDIWRVLLEHLDIGDDHVLRFAFNPTSPLYGWLRRNSRTGDVPINTLTLYQAAVGFVLARDEQRRESRLFEFTRLGYCQKCEAAVVPTAQGCCPECNGELQEIV